MRMMLLASTIPPLIHIIAMKKIVRIQYFTDMSLAAKFTNTTTSDDNSAWKWRWKLHWRKPKRLSQAVEDLGWDFLDFASPLFSSEVADAIRKRKNLQSYNQLYPTTDDNDEEEENEEEMEGEEVAKQSKLREQQVDILNRVGQEIANAMVKMSDKHESNYKEETWVVRFYDKTSISFYTHSAFITLFL